MPVRPYTVNTSFAIEAFCDTRAFAISEGTTVHFPVLSYDNLSSEDIADVEGEYLINIVHRRSDSTEAERRTL